MQRDVSSRIVLNVTEPADLVFAIAASGHYAPTQESISATLDGAAVDVSELPDAHRGRLHRVRTGGRGQLTIGYTAGIADRGEVDEASETERLVYVRPSRYAESDSLAPTAAAVFQGIPRTELLPAVSSWVGTQLAYVSGSSLPTDGAIRTLLSRRGVCRDYSHLCIALLRSLGVPARLAAVYAPGLYPMDFHAVAEAYVNDAWQAVDATTLAPRQTLVRIATGRDAADTAFLNVLSGRIELVSTEIGAVVDTLPDDDITKLVQIG